MRILKFFILCCLFNVLVPGISMAERAGMKELKGMSFVDFKSGSSRIDPDFQLGYGDTITMNLWGRVEASYKLTINRDGYVVIPNLGRVNLIGLTLERARTVIEAEVNKQYTNVEMEVNLVDVRDIRVRVLGNVGKPGYYTMSPFSRLVEAIVKAGGPNKHGSLIDIQVIRDGEKATSFSFYDYFFKGDERKNIGLKHGDTIYIPHVKNLVGIQGNIMAPGIYEIAGDITWKEIVDLAGGFLPFPGKTKFYILRMDPVSGQAGIFKEMVLGAPDSPNDQSGPLLTDHDLIFVTNENDAVNIFQDPSVADYMGYSDLFVTVRISGQVKFPGVYLIKEGEKLSALIKKAGGILEDGYVPGAILTRESVEKKHRSLLDELLVLQEQIISNDEARLKSLLFTGKEFEQTRSALDIRKGVFSSLKSRHQDGRVIIDLEAILRGNSDFALEDHDQLSIPSIPDWVIITGAVFKPTAMQFSEGHDLDFYLSAAGGVTKYADPEQVYVIKPDGKVESKASKFSLMTPGDIIVVPPNLGALDDKNLINY